MGQRRFLTGLTSGNHRERSDRNKRLDAIVFMIVGPHSGFSLGTIFEMKRQEEARLGYFYWGYAGTLCYPPRVCEFVSDSMSRIGRAPKVVMVETKSEYKSTAVGRVQRWSIDRKQYQRIPAGVTLIGCTIAVTCSNLTLCDQPLDLNRYVVMNGNVATSRLGHFVRYQINKACAILEECEPALPPREVRLVATADLVDPYCIYLAE